MWSGQYYGEDGHHKLPSGGKDSSMYTVGQHVIWTKDNRVYVVTAVHVNTSPPNYDLQLLSDGSVTQHNVPEGDMIIATD